MFGCRSCAAARASRRNLSASAVTRDLDGHPAVEAGVAGLPNRAERARAELLEDLELADLTEVGRRLGRRRFVHDAEVRPAGVAVDPGKWGAGRELDQVTALRAADAEAVGM
jgi:hypothetical protein